MDTLNLFLGGGIVFSIGGVIFSFAYNHGKREAMESQFNQSIASLKVEFQNVWKWKNIHEQHAEEARRDLDEKITVLKEKSASFGQFAEEVLRRLKDIEDLLRAQNRNQ